MPPRSTRITTTRRVSFLVIILVFLALACALPGASSVDTQSTSIALGVQASQIAAQATELETQRQAVAVASPTLPPAPTDDLQATEQVEKATAQALEPTNNVVLPSDTPLPQPTEASSAPAEAATIDNWETLFWVRLSSGCQIKDATCWKLNDDFKTTQGRAVAYLTSEDPVLIEESWPRPYLIFLNKRSLRYEARVTLIVDGKPTDVRIVPTGSVAWIEDEIDLSSYKGKSVLVQFSCPVGMQYINAWFIQNIRIVPDYQAE